ncbi:MAG: transporter substrate-binding domain-containing protein [Spirochaetaceae bacterium]|nr:transporter substrate-binding domain-containing protein [Spirochaetaceae bacterium]
MNKRFFVFFLLFISYQSLFSQDAFERIRESGYLKVGILHEPVYPFIYYDQNGDLSGFEIIRSRGIASFLGVDVQFKRYSHMDEIKIALNNGEIDISFHKRFRTLSDGLECFLTLPLAELDMALVINRKAYAALKGHPNKKQSFLDGDFDAATMDQESFLRSFTKEFPHLNLAGSEKADVLWNDIITGREVAVYVDESRAISLFNENPVLGLTLIYLPLGISQEVVGLISWRESFFRDWVNIVIEGWGEPRNMQEILEIIEGETYE